MRSLGDCMVTEGNFLFYVSEGEKRTPHSQAEELLQLTRLRSLYLAAIGWFKGKLLVKNFFVSVGAKGTYHCNSSDLFSKQNINTFIMRPLSGCMVTEGYLFFNVSVGETSHSSSEELFQTTRLRSLYLAFIGWLEGKLKNVSVSVGRWGLLTENQKNGLNQLDTEFCTLRLMGDLKLNSKTSL